MTTRAQEIIKTLNLRPHPEGGYFSETYRSTKTIPGKKEEFPAGRNHSTAIYYLLGSGDISRLHRIKSDEVWHHYEGSSVTIHVIHRNGLYTPLSLGCDLEAGQKPQQVVPAGAWFGATADQPGSYALCGCTVSPGFDFRDFEMADLSEMLQYFPQHGEIIRKLLP